RGRRGLRRGFVNGRRRRAVAIRAVDLPGRVVLGGGAGRCHRSSRGHTGVGRGLPASVNKEACVKQNDDEKIRYRRGFLQCMAWVGTGAMWTLAGGVLKGTPIEQ